MKDICFLPPIPSEIIRRCCATWFIFPSPTRVRWPAVPPDVCPAATVGLPSLTVCVCERVFLCFLAQNPPFPGCSEHKETGSPLQQCTEDYRLHPCLPRAFFPSIQNLTPLCYPSLPPPGACGFSHYFLGVREKEDHVRNGPPLSPSLFPLSRTEKETRRLSVKQTERERKRWWGLVGCKWGEMTDWNEELRGWIMEAKDLTEEEGMRMGWLSSWRQVAVETALFFQTDRQTHGGWLLSVWIWKGYVGMRQQRPRPSAHALICSALMVWYS